MDDCHPKVYVDRVIIKVVSHVEYLHSNPQLHLISSKKK